MKGPKTTQSRLYIKDREKIDSTCAIPTTHALHMLKDLDKAIIQDYS